MVYLDDVRGRCPLCGCTLEDFDSQESEIQDFIERSNLPWLVFNYFLFKRFLEGIKQARSRSWLPLQRSTTRYPGQRAEAGYTVHHGSADEGDRPYTAERCGQCGKSSFQREGKSRQATLRLQGRITCITVKDAEAGCSSSV